MLDLSDAATVRARLDKYAAEQHPPRGDEHYLHVTDLGGCDRETWARRRGLTDTAFDADTHRKFALGFAVEDDVITALTDEPSSILTGVRVAMRVGLNGVEGRVVDEDYFPALDEIIGHPDGVAAGAVIEIKSTEFHLDRSTWERIVPDLAYVEGHSRHYLLQCAAYALALGKPHGLLVIECRTSGKDAVIPFDPADYEAEVIERILAATHATVQPERPEPTLGAWTLNGKRQSWLCKYCHYDDCPLYRGAS